MKIITTIMNNKLNRNAFLKSLGFKGASLLALYCTGTSLSSCSKEEEENNAAPVNVNLTIDLTNPANAALLNTGGYVKVSNVVVANVGNGNYVAASITCPHENNNNISFQTGGFYCSVHGATFNTTGTPTNGITSRTLKIYTVTKDGNTLTIK